jgi:formate hydrogenlyase subunit 3/multisubunit Na+/H+ antiporter MnhD subunit
MGLAPLPVVVPLIVAVALVALGSLASRRILDVISVVTAAGVLGVCLDLMWSARGSPMVYWFGGVASAGSLCHRHFLCH